MKALSLYFPVTVSWSYVNFVTMTTYGKEVTKCILLPLIGFNFLSIQISHTSLCFLPHLKAKIFSNLGGDRNQYTWQVVLQMLYKHPQNN